MPRNRDDVLNAERAALESYLDTVLQRGQESLPALRAYTAELSGIRQRGEWARVLRAIERGVAADAVRDLTAMPEYWIPLLGAATATRDPIRVLREFLDQSRRALELRRQRWRTFAYPALVFGLAAAVLVVINVLIVPAFREMFEEFGLRLPALTIGLLTLSDWIVSGRILIVAAGMLLTVLLATVVAHRLPVSWTDRFASRVGAPFGRAGAVARLAAFTADLLEAGLTVPSALRIAGFGVPIRWMRRRVWCLADDLDSEGPAPRRGAPTRLAPTFLHAVTAELPEGARIQLLRAVSARHADKAEAWSSWTRGAVEPFAICVVGGIVGLMLQALFLPLLALIHGLSS
ncbi:MAG: hypothetical protein FJ297_16225 [Planctomycetes bacterium]|nr:hypothetical protein [Planctomycetota bacterium]